MNGGSWFIIIPEGYDRYRWKHFAQAISFCCKGTGNKAGSSIVRHPQDKRVQVRKEVQLAPDNGGPGADKAAVGAERLFAAHRLPSYNASGGGAQLNNVRAASLLVGNWKKAFVCEREKASD
ncbi:hypothetical protein L1049_001434 [Liquidambar formosana]|uniref:Uncharacterized protein n=1 Tax=Liquidambar formosana TaxID=63359 RepID=A0AAP0R8B8_LIQFO